MKRSSLGAVLGSLGSLLVTAAVDAATYSITFYEQISAGNNLFSNYQVSGSAIFEIDDAAIAPNNLVLFSSPDFVSFDAILNTTAGNARFTLGVDDFPPLGDGTGANNLEQGILFDASGEPLRFDTPSTTAGNGAQICDPSCDVPVYLKDWLILYDDDLFNRVFLSDGTITTLNDAINNGASYTRLGGEWLLDGTNMAAGGADGLYRIQAAVVPVPAAVWLFASGALGLLGMTRHRKS
ncbi:MAG TPA: hypothetical protein ENJ05_06200 [Thiotrichales bacterium]|nr:hypothetical protein [Thiotrichales bacterium]